ncbi:MAG: GatB/YqeY domain-containing protein, partial [Candidatus Krumholzibacteria bacterium]|nr:GatB/YqeY domain-containing protein [Candidatus Krumholzibacteria bacterium]
MRMLISEMKNAQLAERGELSEEKELSIITSYAKKRRESIKGYEQGGRDDLAANERIELEIVMAYLPEQMGEDEIRAEVEKIIAETGASGPQDMGKVMGPLMARFKGRADGGVVKTIAMEALRGGKG